MYVFSLERLRRPYPAAGLKAAAIASAISPFFLLLWLGMLTVFAAPVHAAVPSVGITASDAEARERILEPQSDTATFAIRRTGDTAVALTVKYAIEGTAVAGTHYAAVSQAGTAVIEAGETSTSIVIEPVRNGARTGDKSLQLTLQADPAYAIDTSASSAQATLFDLEASEVTIEVTESAIPEGTGQATIIVRRTGGDLMQRLVVAFRVGGSAIAGSHYALTPSGVVVDFPASSTTERLTLTANHIAEPGDRTVEVELIPGEGANNYRMSQFGSKTRVVIEDDDQVMPKVDFNINEVVERGAEIKLRLKLSAPAPAAVQIPYTVSGSAQAAVHHDIPASGTVEVAQGESEAVLTFATRPDPERDDADVDVVFSMGTPVNARRGVNTRKTVTLTSRNLPPRVRLVITQPDDANHPLSLVRAFGGLVHVTAQVTDFNAGDTHTFDWSGTNSSMTRLNIEPHIYTFEPASLAPGPYRVRVWVTDVPTGSAAPRATMAEVQVFVSGENPALTNGDPDQDGLPDRDEGRVDRDEDGIIDMYDHAGLQPHELPALFSGAKDKLYLIRTEPGLRLRLGEISLIGSQQARILGVQAAVTLEEVAAFGGGEGTKGQFPIDDHEHRGGVFDFEIHDLPVAGAAYKVVIPLLEPLPARATYRKYTAVRGWRDFVVEGMNAIASAQGGDLGTCPPPGDSAYVTGMREGHKCLQLTIVDGGPNDADGVANYVIRDPGGPAVRVVEPDVDTGDDPCGAMVCGSGSGMGAVNPALLALLGTAAGAAAWRRRRVRA